MCFSLARSHFPCSVARACLGIAAGFIVAMVLAILSARPCLFWFARSPAREVQVNEVTSDLTPEASLTKQLANYNAPHPSQHRRSEARCIVSEESYCVGCLGEPRHRRGGSGIYLLAYRPLTLALPPSVGVLGLLPTRAWLNEAANT